MCIVGGGYTGLWTALRQLERGRGLNVVVLEADICRSGASGRNSGAIGTMAPALPMMHRLLGGRGAATVCEAAMASEKDIIETCTKYAIDGQLQQTDCVWVADRPPIFDGWQQTIDIAHQLGLSVPFRIVRGSEIAERAGGARAALPRCTRRRRRICSRRGSQAA